MLTRLLLLTALLLLGLGWPGVGFATELANDNFNRADGGLGANWTTITTLAAPQIRSNLVEPNAVGGSGSEAVYSAIAFPDDQWASVKVVTAALNNTHHVEVIVRGTSAAVTFYGCKVQGPLGATATLLIRRVVAGVATTLAGGTAIYTVNSGDIMRCEIQGSTPQLLINGAAILTPGVDGTPIASGSPGVGAFGSAGTTNQEQLDDFLAGDFGTVTAIPQSTGWMAVMP